MAGMRSAEMVELLGGVPVFSTLERGDLERIAQLAVPRDFEPGEVVFREGDSSDTCYVVSGGRAGHGHSGRPRPAGGIFPRVGEPLSGGAGARRRDLPGTRSPGGARPRGAQALCLLAAMPSSRTRGSRAMERSAGGVVVRGEELVAIVPTRRASDGTSVVAPPKGTIDRGETPLQAAQLEVREASGMHDEPVCVH